MRNTIQRGYSTYLKELAPPRNVALHECIQARKDVHKLSIEDQHLPATRNEDYNDELSDLLRIIGLKRHRRGRFRRV